MFETIVSFKVLPLCLDAVIPAPLPLLGTLSKIFNGNAVKGRQRFLLNLLKLQQNSSLQNGGCVSPPCPISLLATFFFVPTDESGFDRNVFIRRG